MFASALNDIIIKRYNNNRVAGDQIHVNFVYAPKSRVLADIINKEQIQKMPCIAISVGGIRRNSSRVFNKIDGSWWMDTLSKTPSAASWINLLQPVPIDITVNVSILARFQADVDQILTNFIPYSDPYFVISWKWPDIIPFADFEIRNHVRWSENINFQYPSDISNNIPYWTNADTSFTIESWMFKNQLPEGKPIYVINNAFIAVSGINSEYNLLQTQRNTYNTTSRIISARPQMLLVDPFYAYIGNTIISPLKTFKITGRMLDYTQSVFLSSSNWNMFNYTTTGDFITSGPTTIDKFSTSSFTASASYPPFTGVELLSSNWNKFSESNLQFTFTPLDTGIFDIILLNEAGYGVLTKDSIRPTLNPYPIEMVEYANYIEYQYPCTSGIEIRNI